MVEMDGTVPNRIEVLACGQSFELDLDAKQLFREHQTRIHLSKQQWALLLYFAENPGRTLTKNDLIDNVWGGRFVSDDAVTRAISSLRQCLGDDPDQPEFIETMFGVGYRFIAEVTHVAAATAKNGTAKIVDGLSFEAVTERLKTKSGLDKFTHLIAGVDDLHVVERCLSSDKSNTLTVRNALVVIARLASNWDGRTIVSATSFDRVRELYDREDNTSVRIECIRTLSALQTFKSRKFICQRFKELRPAEVDAVLSSWADEIAYWSDEAYWRKKITAGALHWLDRPVEECLFINDDGGESDARHHLFRMLGELNIAQALSSIEHYIRDAEWPLSTIVQAAGAHWKISGKKQFVSRIEAALTTDASNDAAAWLETIQLSEKMPIQIESHEKEENYELLTGIFLRNKLFNFEVHLTDRASSETYRDTRIIEMYIKANDVIQWSWSAHVLNNEPSWRFGRLLRDDLFRGLSAAM